MDNKNKQDGRSEIDAILEDLGARQRTQNDDTLAPPEPSIDTPVPESAPADGKKAGKKTLSIKKLPKPGPRRSKKKDDEKAEAQKEPSDHRNRRAKIKAFFRSLTFKIILCVLAAAVVIVAVVFGVRAANERKIADTEEKYGVTIADGMQTDHIEEYAANQDFVGRLSIAGSDIDYNVYQGDDNLYYATRDENARNNESGSVYMDWRASTDPQSRNTVLYASNAYFGALESMYATPEACAENPVITFNTLYQNAEYKVVGAFYTNADKAADNGKMFPYAVANLTDDAMIEFRTNLSSRLLYTTGRDILLSDKVLMLSAASDLFDSACFVVVAVQMTSGDSNKLDADDCTVNENVYYPQAYYDKTGAQNPYATASQWYPTVQLDGEDTSRLNDKDLDAYLN